MTATHPRNYFDNFVKRAYREWVDIPTDEYRAKVAVSELNNMAARLFRYWEPKDRSKVHGAKSEGEYRNHLAESECVDFGLVRDVAEAHKHVSLTRASRQVTHADQTKRITVQGGTLGNFILGSDVLGGDEIVIEKDDGNLRSFHEVADNVLAMWERVLDEMGL